MITKYLFPLLSAIGFAFAIFMVIQGAKPVIPAQPVVEPAKPEFATFIAGAGIVEASSENIAIGSPTPGIVTRVYVESGSMVKAGDPLFSLDDRPLQAELQLRKATLQVTQAQLERLKASPRPEELPPLEARLKQEQASLDDLKSQLSLYESITDARAISKDELDRRRFAVAVAEARMSDAKSMLDLTKAGTWKPDIQVAEAQVASNQAMVNQTMVDIDRLTIRSPVDGQIMQNNTHLGEFAAAGVQATPLMIVGSVATLNVRVNIDENDAWRLGKTARAKAYARGNQDIQTPLKFVRFDPLVIPKKSLTGESTERVDTRVLQAIYSFDPKGLPLYVGQQVDVLIDAPAPAGKPGLNKPETLDSSTPAVPASGTSTNSDQK